MIKLQKNKIKILISIIILLIGTVYFLYNEFCQNDYDEYNINNDFILYGTDYKKNLVSNNVTVNNSDVHKNKIVIHIMGEVIKQGIVNIDEGGRIIDAINAAGGLTELADLAKVNLAYILKDGQKVVIPSVYDKDSKSEIVSDDSGDFIIEEYNNNEKYGKVNINNATRQELMTLPGIGESTAQKIIDYREENGKFSDIAEIKNVSGIGESKFNTIKDLITV